MSLPAVSVSSQPAPAQEADECCACQARDNISWCLQCIDTFCDTCWPKERPHKAGKVLENGLPHAKVNIGLLRRLKPIFDQPTEEEQQHLHNSDNDTSWFGFRDDIKQEPYIYSSNRLIDLLCETQNGKFKERFPHLVSFVGQTGAGKSTIIKMLMKREHAKAELLDLCPVPGRFDDNLPTTADVHLYSDPLAGHTQKPILYADSEGMYGGETMPRGLESQSQAEAKGGRRVRDILKNQISRTLAWASDDKKRSREFSVKNLFPKVLYTFSDVIVFVLRESSKRTFESEVFQLLVEWAATSIDKSLNQPSRPHVIIVFNAAEATGDVNQWNRIFTTDKLFNDHKELVKRIPSHINLPEGINTSKAVLEYYYSSVSVLKIPIKSFYTQLDDQITELYGLIQEKCNESHDFKRKARILLNTEKLPRYVSAALGHFSRSLDIPFDFVAEARRYLSPPLDFGGHMLNFIMSTYNKWENAANIESLFSRLARPIASSVMMAAIRDNTQGTYSSVFQSTYREPLQDAITEFSEKWLRCSFRKGGRSCVNVRSSHEKGHQSNKGAILDRGNYQSPLGQQFFLKWVDKIQRHIEAEENVDRQGEENISIPKMHMSNMEKFYTELYPGFILQSGLTCPCCLGKIPEHALACDHIICKACVQSIGKRNGPGLFEVWRCPLHPGNTSWPSPVQIRYKPEEAGVRTLCLDGGGVKGIVELVILRNIEEALGNHIPIQNFFDLIVGTSAGGIIALGLGVENWKVENCMSYFKDLCRQSFTKRVPRLLRPLAAVKGKSIYRSKPFEKALRSAFSTDSALYGGPQPGRSAIRVAVTTTLAREDEAAILSNYNRDRRFAKALCTFIRPQDPDDEVKVWEAARATSAAPPYFKPFIHQKTMHTYADGAIHHHCPVFIADQERRQLWEDVKDWQPDIVLSVGSGLSVAKKNSELNVHGFIGQQSKSDRAVHGLGYLLRLASTIIERQLNCEDIWKQYCNQARPASSSNSTNSPRDDNRYFRLNAEFADYNVAFDDVGSIKKLEQLTQEAMQSKKQKSIQRVAEKLIASCFYFESTSPATRDPKTKQYECSGIIRCRFHEDTSDLRGLGEILSSYCSDKFTPHFLIQNDLQDPCVWKLSRDTIKTMTNGSLSKFHQDIQIKAIEQSSITSIFLRLHADGDRTAPNISGFPRQLYGHSSYALSELEEHSEFGEEEIDEKYLEASLSPSRTSIYVE